MKVSNSIRCKKFCECVSSVFNLLSGVSCTDTSMMCSICKLHTWDSFCGSNTRESVLQSSVQTGNDATCVLAESESNCHYNRTSRKQIVFQQCNALCWFVCFSEIVVSCVATIHGCLLSLCIALWDKCPLTALSQI